MSGVQLWDTRQTEPDYAKLGPAPECASNVYGQAIDLIELLDNTVPREQSLYINDNPAVGENPDRNKQHAFYFTADNCIGCHACESACAEKNETPSHLAFRSVGYVEGGSYPDFQRMNISMACNHCDDPVCLKGCPTNAYTKHTEYGAVLQDPDTCFGCGYCTWVCPYNAPQLDPVKGQVSKCNMCVDRLEVGLKPACVSACVGNALDFGVVEAVPENRSQAKTAIPGFPDPSISQPNIRFQQRSELPDEMTRTDTAPIKYRRSAEGDGYHAVLDPKLGKERSWNLGKLYSHENPLVLFTLLTQAAIGLVFIPALGAILGVDALHSVLTGDVLTFVLITAFLLSAGGLLMSTVHLGKPMRFYRGFNNLRYSPVSREGFGVAIFMAFAVITALASLPRNDLLNSALEGVAGTSFAVLDGSWLTPLLFTTLTLALLGGAGGLFYMIKCYLIPARPFWNHWQTASAFVGNGLSLGSLILGAIVILLVGVTESMPVLQTLAIVVAIGTALEAIGLIAHRHANRADAQHEGAASQYVQVTEFGKTYVLRNVLMLLNLSLAIFASLGSGDLLLVAWALLNVSIVCAALLGRALFYVLVIPTTMPGAFFWRNKGFADHAREIGLQKVVDAGLV
ncbi:MAG: DmsC/YnfH family molybdoenzyme membrane anchor subunit [Pseudomonadota bacterium]